MTPSDERKRQQCLDSMFWVGWHLCGYRKLSMVLHMAMTMWLQRAWADGWQRVLVMIPRDYFKTSALGIAGVVWEIIRNPDIHILYVMHKHSIAAEKMDEVQAAFESPMMLRLFPELAVTKENVASLKWTSGSFTVPRPSGPRGTPTVSCAGIITGTTGNHYDLIIWDDPVKGDDEDATAQMKAAQSKIRKVTFLWKNRRVSRFLVMGTLWEGGFYEDLMLRKNFARLILGAYVDDRFERFIAEVGIALPGPDDPYVLTYLLPSNRSKPWAPGTAIFPEQEDDQSLADAKEDSQDDFETQMLNIPTDAEKRRFRRDDFITYDLRFKAAGRPAYAEVDGVAYPYSHLFRTLTWDPTGGKGKDCDTAAVSVCGFERANRKAFLLDRWHERADILTQVERVLDMAAKWDVKLIAPEKAGFQVVLEDILREKMKERVSDGRLSRMIKIDPYVRGAKSKGAWILDSLAGWVSGGHFHVLPEHGDVIDHLVGLRIRNNVVLGESPGLADSLAMHRKYWRGRIDRDVFDDGIRDEDDEPMVLNMPVKYGLEPSKWQGGLAV